MTGKAPVTMSLMGGLGNQLFQLATGLEVAHRAGTGLQLDIAWYRQALRRTPGGLVLRPYELAGIADDIPVVPTSDSRMTEFLGHARDVVTRRGARWVNRLPTGFHSEVSGAFDPRVLELGPGARLWGYYASWRYFPTVAPQVRQRILESPMVSPWAHEQAAASAQDGAVALHVRRGDYLTLASTYGHVRPVYYARAVSLLRSLGCNGPVWLFSDEPRAALAWLTPEVNVDRVIEPPQSAASIDSLFAMSAAAGIVIANSTYSWWAAFLRDRPGRPVVAPRPSWAVQASDDGRDSLLPRWLSVDCREFHV